MRGNCSDPDAAAAMSMPADLAAALRPLKPRQCLLLVPDTLLTVLSGTFWLDNVYLALAPRKFSRDLAFLTAGLPGTGPDENSALVSESEVAVTNVTFHGEGDRGGGAWGVVVSSGGSAMFLGDCLFTEWRGGMSPITVSSAVTVQDTVFDDVHLAVELVDVSFGGAAHFANVSLAGVALQAGRVVATTANDYEEHDPDDYEILKKPPHYADDDANTDVAITAVRPSARSAFQEDYVIVEDVMSDCMFLAAPADVVLPGCPPETVALRAALGQRLQPEGVAPENELDSDVARVVLASARALPTAPWLLELRRELGPLPPPPAGWPDFAAALNGLRGDVQQPVRRNGLVVEWPVPPGLLVPGFMVTPEAAAAADAVPNPLPATASGGAGGAGVGPTAVTTFVAVGVVGCVVALLALAWAAVAVRRPPSAQDKAAVSGASLTRASALSRDASGWTPSHATEHRSGRGPARGTQHVPRSVMNPDYEYALPPQLAMLMGGPTLQTTRHDGEESRRSTTATSASDTSSSKAPLLRARSAQLRSDAVRPAVADSGAVTWDAGSVARAASAGWLGGLDVTVEGAGSTVVVSPFDSLHTSHDASAGTVTSTGTGAATGTAPATGPCATPSAADSAAAQSASASEIAPAAALSDSRGTCMGKDTSASAPRPGALRPDGQQQGRQQSRQLQRQLDAFGDESLFLGRYTLLGRQHRLRGGQGVVQFAEDRQGCTFAVKFFLDRASFHIEAALYAAAFPFLRRELSPEALALTPTLAPDDVAAAEPGGHAAALARFLPQVEALCDGTAGGLVDPRGRRLPPCIVMEKGESLHEWSSRAEPDLFMTLAVLSHLSRRLADMHDAGYVHRDLKPGNVMWLPRQNRWTVIDFGCVARAGAAAPLSFTVAYAAPEVAVAALQRRPRLEAAAAQDAWALGVMAYELLTGAPAFNLLLEGATGVLRRLAGERPLPWEGALPAAAQRRLGLFKGPVLQLLHREPGSRPSMRTFHAACTQLFTDRGAPHAPL